MKKSKNIDKETAKESKKGSAEKENEEKIRRKGE